LEGAYRQRLVQVHSETKKRLDYHLSVHNVLQRVEKEQMLNFILNETNKAIGGTQEKDVLQACLVQLKGLSQKYANSI
jgi:F-type H+-transporting ATPase subunit b